MRLVKCPICGNSFDRTKEEYLYRNCRYIHKVCYEEKYPKKVDEAESEALIMGENGEPQRAHPDLVPPPRSTAEHKPKPIIRKCFYCGQDIDISSPDNYRKPRVNRYAHIECYEKNYVPDDVYIDKIYEFLKNIGMNYDYLQCERQRTSYIAKMGYTNEGILNALKYFYSIQRQSIAGSGNRIGIVPYVYDEAQLFYRNLEKTQRKLVRTVTKQIEGDNIEVHINVPESPVNKHYIDIDAIGSD